MAELSVHHPWILCFGILGNIISFLVFISPVPTFYRVYKKKSTEGFQSIPYVVALFSSMLWIYYALLKTNAYLIVSINVFGCFIEFIFITMYLVYAPKRAKIYAAMQVLLLDVLIFGLIVLLTFVFSNGPNRVHITGWISMGFSVAVFAAPLGIIRLVIRTKSVEFMPFLLSLFHTLSAVVWFFYGFLKRDMYVLVPNILGFVFGVIQMALFMIYNDSKKEVKEMKPAEHVIAIGRIGTPRRSEIHPLEMMNIDEQIKGNNKESMVAQEKTNMSQCAIENMEAQEKTNMSQCAIENMEAHKMSRMGRKCEEESIDAREETDLSLQDKKNVPNLKEIGMSK